MRSSSAGLALGLLALIAGCAAPLRLPDGGVANVPQQLFLAVQRGDTAAPPSLLAADARLLSADGSAEGREAVQAVLSGMALGAGVPAGHHDVARLRLPDGRLVFALAEGAVVSTVVVFAGGATGSRSAELAQYQAAWNEGAVDRRRAMLSTAWDPSARYVDPGNDVQGVAGLEATIAAFREAFPGATLVAPEEIISAPGGWVVADWRLEAPASPPLLGFDVGHLASTGKLDLIAGFFNPR